MNLILILSFLMSHLHSFVTRTRLAKAFATALALSTVVSVFYNCSAMKEDHNEKQISLISNENLHTQNETTLLEACKQGNQKLVIELLEKGADINTKDENDLTPFLHAVDANNIAMMEILHTYKADMYAFDKSGDSAMHRALCHNATEAVEWLYKQDQTFINKPGNKGDGWTPLHEAIQAKNYTLTLWLIDKGADTHATYLNKKSVMHKAVIAGHLKIIQKLHELNSNFITQIDGNGWTPWDYVFLYNKAELIDWFLQHEMDIKTTLAHGNTVAHIAALSGSLEVLKKLHEIDSALIHSVNAIDQWTVFHSAAQGKCPKTVQWLYDQKVDISSLTAHGDTVAHIAARNGSLEVLKKLHAINSALIHSVKATDHCTVFHSAAQGKCPKTVQWLYDQKVDISSLITNGNTVAHITALNGSLEVLKKLHAINSALINSVNATDKWTVFHSAVKGGCPETVQWLYEKKVDITSLTNEDENALHIACWSKNINVKTVKLLLEMNIDVHAQEKNEQTPLYKACFAHEKVNTEAIKLLLIAGANPMTHNLTIHKVLRKACYENREDIVSCLANPLELEFMNDQKLLTFICNVNKEWKEAFKIFLMSIKKDRATPPIPKFLRFKILLHAWNDAYNDLLVRFCSRDKTVASIFETREDNKTINFLRHYKNPILSELDNNEPNMSIIINALKRGVNVNVQGDNKITPLMDSLLQHQKNITLIKTLVEYGADVNARNNNQSTPLMTACMVEDITLEVVKFLIENGSRVNDQNVNGSTALHFACLKENPNLEVIKFLLKNNANPSLQNANGDNVLHKAAYQNNEALYRHIKNHTKFKRWLLKAEITKNKLNKTPSQILQEQKK